MMNRKRLWAIPAATAMLCAFAGCENNDSAPEPDRSPQEQVEFILREMRESTPTWAEVVENAESLHDIGKPAVPLLIEALDDESWRVRQMSVEALGRIGETEALELLIRRLDDEDERVRGVVPRALGAIGDDAAVEPLINAMNTDPDSGVRHQATQALGEFRGERVVRSLINALDAQDTRVVMEAMSSLAKTGDESAVGPLAQRLNAERAIRLRAAESLGRLGDPRALEPLVSALDQGNAEMRATVVLALGELGDPRAVEPLAEALKNTEEDVAVRTAAAQALGMIGGEEAIEALRAVRPEDNQRVFNAAQRALE